jgi:carbohydrate-binding DOMON domain-containing protein
LTWGNFPIAYTTSTVTKIVPVTATKTDTLTLTETAVVTATQYVTQTAVSYVTQTKEVHIEKPYVDPISYAVLGLGVIAGIAGALVAARRK